MSSRLPRLTILALAALAYTFGDTFSFSFSGNGITSSGTFTAIQVSDGTSGITTPGTYEITGITGTFSDSNAGISGAITGLYTPVSYVTPLTATTGNPLAFTGAGLSYDDLFFPGGNSPADCPGYNGSGGYFDVYGVAFNVAGGYVGEFFSNGVLQGYPGAVHGAADANATTQLDNPNPIGALPGPQGVVGALSIQQVPEPATLPLAALGLGLVVASAVRRRRRDEMMM